MEKNFDIESGVSNEETPTPENGAVTESTGAPEVSAEPKEEPKAEPKAKPVTQTTTTAQAAGVPGGKKKNNKIVIMAVAAVLVVAIIISSIAVTLSLLGGGKADAFVIMSEELDGLFNPFFSTTAADGTIVSMTQIGMLTTEYKNNEVTVAFGDDYAVVTKDYQSSFDATAGEKGQTTYTFVIKNGIKFSDGKPLTIGDVLFNMYVYLDPVYTGSSTMYSTDILGLAEYRSQQIGADSDVDASITAAAQSLVNKRINELINLFRQTGEQAGGSYSATVQQMLDAIETWNIGSGYKEAISNNPDEVTSANLKADYELALKYFKEELGNDWVSSQEAYKEDKAYKGHPEFNDPIFCFMCYEGLVTIEYEKDPITNKDDFTKIKKLTPMYNTDINTKEAAIDYVYNRKISTEFDQIIKYWATAQKLETEFLAKAKEVVINQNITGDELTVKNISGIVSLGHTKGYEDVTTVTVNGTPYKVAHEHNDDGTPKNADEYDVLQVTINGVDPKAVWNFAFSVAPQHYYAGSKYPVDIENNQFGVEFNSFDFMTKEIQSVRNIKVPMGAGAYKATNAANEDNPEGTAFFANNVVYFKANNYFETVGENINNAKIEKIRYRVVSASNALNALESGEVHYVTPQLTDDNYNKINALKAQGIVSAQSDQLGYGYIGINAGKVKDINLRKAIMSAMNTTLALSYYRTGTAQTIYWPMSMVSWAYPKAEDGSFLMDNGVGHEYAQAYNFSDDAAKEAIRNYMEAAGVAEGDPELAIKFTIAGSNLTEHPTYNTFIHAAKLLNECGWKIEVVADTQALTKLSTGSLAVWAAAWGSTIDPDLYQVYHKNSTATSVLAWGYREILEDTTSEEYAILSDLSELIDLARETDNQKTRQGLYKQALGKILDLAIELPVYQRSVLYAYNGKVIDENTIPQDINPYSSPLDRIWEIDFVK